VTRNDRHEMHNRVELFSCKLNLKAREDTCVQVLLVKSLQGRRDCGTRFLIPVQ
jgi:hypothetical protein